VVESLKEAQVDALVVLEAVSGKVGSSFSVGFREREIISVGTVL
jgi:hypothetical protein